MTKQAKNIIWTKEDLKKALGNTKIPNIPNITGVSIDTRKIRKGDMFFALSGKNFNGNEFINIALAKGASLCFTDNIKKVEL